MVAFEYFVNLPILDLSKSKAFANNKCIVTQNMKVALHRVENIVNTIKCWLSPFSPFPAMFSKSSFHSIFESPDYVDWYSVKQ